LAPFPPAGWPPVVARVRTKLPRYDGMCFTDSLPRNMLTRLVTEANLETCEYITIFGDWKAKFRERNRRGIEDGMAELNPPTPNPEFVTRGDTVIRHVTAGYQKVITARIDVRGVKRPDGSCELADTDVPHVNPAYDVFPEVGQLNRRTCQAVIWVIDPHLPEYGPMTSDTTVLVAPAFRPK
jgi:hypothetical protein